MLLMSFFSMNNVTDGLDRWSYVGAANYHKVVTFPLFGRAMENLLWIWVIGGVVTLGLALLYAAIISSGVKGKAFWRSVVYLPNIISMVALSAMWVHYIYNARYGLLTTVFKALGLTGLAAMQWTDQTHMFWSMLFSFCFGSLGYYMLIFLAGIDRIPGELYESAYMDGAGRVRSFFSLTVPLLRNVIRTALSLWTIGTGSFYVWSVMFSSRQGTNSSTVVPVRLMNDYIIGSNEAISTVDVGAGAAIGIVLAVLVLVVYSLQNLVFPERRIEY